MSDDLDPILRAALSGEDGTPPESLERGFAARVRARRRVNMFRTLGATAMVFAVMFGTVMVVRSHPTGGLLITTTPTPTLKDGTPTPTPSHPPTPTPSHPPTPSTEPTPACTGADLDGKPVFGGGAAGSYQNKIAFIDTSTHDCFVQGRPSVTLITTDGRRLPPSVDRAGRFPDDGPVKVVLHPGGTLPSGEGAMTPGTAYLGIEWHDCNTADHIARVEIALPIGTVAVPEDQFYPTGQAACGASTTGASETIANNWQAAQ